MFSRMIWEHLTDSTKSHMINVTDFLLIINLDIDVESEIFIIFMFLCFTFFKSLKCYLF